MESDKISKHAVETMNKLWQYKYFSDIELYCMNGELVKAHKGILSINSETFRELLLENPTASTLDMSYLDENIIKHLLEFIYVGEVSVPDDRINEFVEVGNYFKLKGLVIEDNVETQKEVLNDYLIDSTSELTNIDSNDADEMSTNIEHLNNDFIKKFPEVLSDEQYIENEIVAEEEDVINEKPVAAVMEESIRKSSFNQSMINKDQFGNSVCSFCDYKNGKKENIIAHIRFVHPEIEIKTIQPNRIISGNRAPRDVSYLNKDENGLFMCPKCEYKSKRRKTVIDHKRNAHVGKTLLCNECDFTTSRHSYLSNHKKVKHLGIKYKCKSCDAEFRNRGILSRHTRSVHSNNKYICSQCDFQNKDVLYLKHHVKTLHEGFRHCCKYCSFKTKQRTNLTNHIKARHKDLTKS